MKVYTQTGDQGKTSLLSGERVAKSNVRIQAYGEIDELNSVVGALIAALSADSDTVRDELRRIQSDLFEVGAWLAATPGSEVRSRLSPVTSDHSRRIETFIDAMDEQLPELKRFILPGGDVAAAWAHIARTVCRRAERGVISLADQEGRGDEAGGGIGPVIVYINRLSDYFFVLARWLNHKSGTGDVLWQDSTGQWHDRDAPYGGGQGDALVDRRDLRDSFREAGPLRLSSGAEDQLCRWPPSSRLYAFGPVEADELALCVRLVANGRFSPRLARASSGDRFRITAPFGYFTYKASSRPAVFVATGTGIAPFVAFARAGIRGFDLLHGGRNASALYYQEILADSARTYTPCISGISSRESLPGSFAGRVDQYLATVFPEGVYDFYLCGLSEMIRDVTRVIDLRFPDSRLFMEAFD